MRVFQLAADERYWSLIPEREEDWDIIDLFGRPLGRQWEPLNMVPLKRDAAGRELLRPDLYFVAHDVPAANERALGILRPLIEPFAEILPLSCPTEKVFALNVITVIDALDYERSIVRRFPGSNHLADVEVPVFRPGAVDGVQMFRIPLIRRSYVYIGERFVRACQRAGLQGLTFQPIASV